MAVAPRQRPSLSAARSPQPMAPWPARRCWVWHERIATGEGVAADTLPFATTAVRGSSGCAVAAWSARSGRVRPSSHGHEGQERGAKHCGVRGILCDCWALLPPCTPLSKHSPRLSHSSARRGRQVRVGQRLLKLQHQHAYGFRLCSAACPPPHNTDQLLARRLSHRGARTEKAESTASTLSNPQRGLRRKFGVGD